MLLKLKNKIKKIFTLEVPYALPYRPFCKDDYAWQDWEKEIKQKYPIKFFIYRDFPILYSRYLSGPIVNFIYKIKSKYIKKHHLLDLRQPHTGTEDDYKFGYIDQDSKLLFACFNVLVDYVEESNNYDCSYGINNIKELEKEIEEADELNGSHLKQQLDFLKEVKWLYEYWTIQRKIELKKIDKASENWHNKLEETNDSQDKDVRAFFDIYVSLEETFKKEEEQALIRLIKIRQGLWV